MINNRQILTISGTDVESFLQQILTNDLKLLNTIQYHLLLTPQGKLLHDLFLIKLGNKIILDCNIHATQDIIDTLKKYQLGADVQIDIDDTMFVYGNFNNDGYQDPRHPKFGFRAYSNRLVTADSNIDYNSLHYDLSLPQLYRDFDSGQYFPFELKFDKFNAISYNKGCYIGQEVITRTAFRGVVRKSIYKLAIDSIEPLTEKLAIFVEEQKIGNILGYYKDNHALALLKSDLLDSNKQYILKGNIPCNIIQSDQ